MKISLNTAFCIFIIFLISCNSPEKAPEVSISELETVEKGQENVQETSQTPAKTTFLLPSEILIFSFQTKNYKQLVIAIDKDEEYIKYRFGTKDTVELEYPISKEDSWSKFSYWSYMRGGGPANEGLHEFRLTFENNGYQYEVFDEYYSVTDETTIGVKINTPNSDKEIVIKGKSSTQKGSLSNLNDYEKLEREQ